MDVSLVVVLLLVLAAEFTNGLTDAPNAIATVVSTRVISPYRAVAMAAVLNILGVLVTGTAVTEICWSRLSKRGLTWLLSSELRFCRQRT